MPNVSVAKTRDLWRPKNDPVATFGDLDPPDRRFSGPKPWKEYQHGTIAHRLYEASKLPATLDLLKDLQLLVEAYHAIVRSELARHT